MIETKQDDTRDLTDKALDVLDKQEQRLFCAACRCDLTLDDIVKALDLCVECRCADCGAVATAGIWLDNTRDTWPEYKDAYVRLCKPCASRATGWTY